MIKAIFSIILISLWSYGNEATQSNIYILDIDVKSNKDNGKSWDIAGGSPDIKINIDGKNIPFKQDCKNHYRCSISFMSEKINKEWYFEIYDKDFNSDDLIGKGNCSFDKSCKLGRAKITIRKP